MPLILKISDLNVVCDEDAASAFFAAAKDYEVFELGDRDSIQVSLGGISQDDASQVAVRYLRQICEQLPHFNRLFFHGAAISFRGNGYLFAAPSGTGKSTLIANWRRCLGSSVDIVCGDKPILQIEGPEKVGERPETTVWGTPWGGKEGWQRNTSAPLAGICFLEQSESNEIVSILPEDAVTRIMAQVYIPRDADSVAETMELVNRIVRSVPLFLMKCSVSIDAVRCSFEAMTGLNFKDYAIG